MTATTSDDQFLFMMGGKKVKDSDVTTIQDAGLNVRYVIDPIGVVVAQGTSSQAKKTGYEWAPDVDITVETPRREEIVQDVDEGDGCYDLDVTQEELAELKWDTDSQNIREAHEITKGEGTKVAILDSGVDHTHPDLAPNVNEELSRTSSPAGNCPAPGAWGGSHGTHVAGIVGADDSTPGVVGAAPDTELVDARIFPAPANSDCGEGDPFDPEDDLKFKLPKGTQFGVILRAIAYAAEAGCDVANLSLGIGHRKRSNNGRFYGQAWARTTAYAQSKGTLLVSAAGNANIDLQHDGGLVSVLTEAPNMMTVAAAGPLGHEWDAGKTKPPWTPAGYSNEGTNAIDVGAAGGNYPFDDDVPADGWYWNELWANDLVLSTVPSHFTREDLFNECQPLLPMYFTEDGSVYRPKAGTSMASPQVAGIAALVKSADPNASPRKVRSIIKETAKDVGDRYHLGAGYVDAAAAVRKAAQK